MAVRRRRSPIGAFTQSLMQGLQLGFQHADRQEAARARRDAIVAAREKAAAQADYNRQKLGIESKKADAYVGLSAANARKADRWTPGGGGAAQAPGLSPGMKAYYDANGGMPPGSGEVTPPSVYNVSPPASEPAATPEPPAFGSDDSGLGAARGGKIPQRMARGGRPRPDLTNQFQSGLMNSMRMMDYIDRASQRRNASLKNVGPIKKVGSTPINEPVAPPTQPTPPVATGGIPAGTGTTGPGSGYGETAPPPMSMDYGAGWDAGMSGSGGWEGAGGYDSGSGGQAVDTSPAPAMTDSGSWGTAGDAAGWDAGMTYQQGGRVQRFQQGGLSGANPMAGTSLLGQLGAALGSRWWNSITPGQAPPTRAVSPAAPPGRPMDPQYTNDDRAASQDWVERGPSSRARNDRGYRPPVPRTNYPAEDYENMPPRQEPRDPPSDPMAEQVGPTGTDVVVTQSGLKPPGAIATNGGPRRGGGGYQARGGGLGDQRRTTAYDPVKDRMDPRNIGVVYEPGQTPKGLEGNVNPMVYAARGLELTAPGQQIYQRGGRVQKFDGGGMPQRLPVPVSGREYGRPTPGQDGGGMPPQGGGEAESAGQAEADALTAMWREEAHRAAQTNQQAAAAPPQAPPAPEGGPMGSEQYIPPLPDREPQPSRQGGYAPPEPVPPSRSGELPPYEEQPGEPQMDRYGRPLPTPYNPYRTMTLPEKQPQGPGQLHDEAGGSPNQRYTPDRMERPEGTESQPSYDPSDPGNRIVNRRPDRMEGPDRPEQGPPSPSRQGDYGPGKAPPPFQGEEARADERRRPPPGAAGPARPGVSTPAGPSAGQVEADRLTEEWNRKNQAGQQGGVGPITKKGAVDMTPPQAQTTGEPEGGYGLAGPGHGISTNNAARDYLGGATTFANWAMKDAGPKNQQQAQAALFSGKGAAMPQEMAATFMAVDPDGTMPLDKRMEAAAKTVHDYYMAKGDVKQASEAAFQVAQFGVSKSREHGGAALKLLQAGNEQGALKELMAGYSWLPDKGSARVDGQSIVVTGDDGKIRAQIPLQPGTVENLALGMMSGQLGWDAIRRGTSGGGTTPPPPQAVNAQPPTLQKPSSQYAGPATPPAQPSAASAGPAAPPVAINAAPPAAQSRPATAAPTVAPAAAPRPPASTPAKATPPGGGQVPPGKGQYETSTMDRTPTKTQREAPDVNVPFVPAGSDVARGAAGETKTDPKTGLTSTTDPKTGAISTTDTKKPNNEATNPSNPEEKELKAHLDKHPFTPPPRVLNQQAPDNPELSAYNQRLRQIEEDHMKRRHNAEHGKEVTGLTPKERKEAIPKKLKELDDAYKEQRRELLAERGRFTDKAIRAQEHERNVVLKPRDLSTSDAKELASAFSTRTKQIDEAKVRGKDDPKAKLHRDNSVLRYKIDDDERRPLYRIAQGIWQHNKGMSPDDAVEHAIVATSIVKEGVGHNYQVGKNAAQFRPYGGNLARGVIIQMRDGTTINVDASTYNQILDMRKDNWDKREQNDADKKQQQGVLDKANSGLAARAIKTLPPSLQGVAGAVGLATGAFK